MLFFSGPLMCPLSHTQVAIAFNVKALCVCLFLSCAVQKKLICHIYREIYRSVLISSDVLLCLECLKMCDTVLSSLVCRSLRFVRLRRFLSATKISCLLALYFR